MSTFRQLTESLIAIWTESTPAARAGLATMVAMCIVMLGYVGYWSAMPSYVNLQFEDDEQNINAVVDALEKKGIDYKLSGAGGVVKVNSRQLALANLELSKLNVSVSDGGGSAGFGSSMFEDKTQRHERMVREKQAKIANMLRKMNKIVDADVTLSIPMQNLFERAVEQPSASVVLTLRRNQILTSSDVMGVASAIANSVERLQMKDVFVTDTTSQVYPTVDATGQGISTQKDFTTQMENELVAKALTQLNRMLGPGNAGVTVSLEYIFTRKKQKSTEYDKSGKVAQTETIDTEEGTGIDLAAAGAAGVSPNIGGGNSSSSSQLGGAKKENLQSVFLVPETIEENENNTPTRTSMHVSVVVNDQAEGVRQEDGSLKPDIQQTIEDIVRDAVGFKEELGSMTVSFSSFYQAPEQETATPFDWGFLNDILRNASLAIAAIVVLILGMKTLKHFKPAPTTASVATSDDQSTNINQLNELAKSNPEVFARILKSWAGDKNNNETGSRAA